MIVEILGLFASAGSGQLLSVTWQWATKKADEKNHVIEKALIASYCKALEDIRCQCRQLPEWRQHKGEIEARLESMQADALEILDLMPVSPRRLSPAAPNSEEGAIARVMDRLESEEHWLGEAPPVLRQIVRERLVQVTVYRFQHEVRNEPTVFRTLVRDMLAAVGQDVGELVEVTNRIDTNLDGFVRQYSQNIDLILTEATTTNILLDKLAAKLQRRRAVPANFASLIADLTDGFEGRGFVFAAIEEFLRQQSKGYFILEADPGVGKSAILAEYVRRNACVAYFNRLSEGITSTGDFLKSVCTQLIEGYGLKYELPLHPDNTSNGNFLSMLLNEIGGQLGGEKLVIAVDALDEVNLKSQSAGANVLYLPGSLPEGVYFVVSKRPENLPLVVSAPQMLFDLMVYPDQSLADVRSFVGKRAQREKVRGWIDEKGATVAEFVESVARKSENNFMYLKYVLDDIEEGKYDDVSLESLPQGLMPYYYLHWQRMGMNVEPLPVTKLKVIYFLTETRKPISCGMLAKLSGEESLAVQEILDEWEQFLRVEPTEGKPVYSIYHGSFHNFLHRQDIVQEVAPAVRPEGIVKQITSKLLGMVYKNG